MEPSSRVDLFCEVSDEMNSQPLSSFRLRAALKTVSAVCVALGLCAVSFGAPVPAPTSTPAPAVHHIVHRRVVHHVVRHTASRAAVLHVSASIETTSHTSRSKSRRVIWSPWTEPTYADSTFGDNVEGEDMVARKAAVDALGPYNGTVIVADPQTGRLLSVVNQKLALKGAFQPCSTVKLVVSLASLREGLVESTTKVQLARRFSMDMTGALAKSNNLYFATLGQKLGFDKVAEYTKMFGIGGKGWFGHSG